jgi:hypothetical protein
MTGGLVAAIACMYLARWLHLGRRGTGCGISGLDWTGWLPGVRVRVKEARVSLGGVLRFS